MKEILMETVTINHLEEVIIETTTTSHMQEILTETTTTTYMKEILIETITAAHMKEILIGTITTVHMKDILMMDHMKYEIITTTDVIRDIFNNIDRNINYQITTLNVFLNNQFVHKLLKVYYF